MQNLPEVGKIYISRLDQTFRIYVENVGTLEADEDEPESFWVEGCDPKDKGDMSGIGYEFTEEEWIEHDFTPA